MTGSTLGTLLVLALTAALSPFSLVAFSLVLATDRGPRNGVAFICGWITTVALIGVAMSFLGSSVSVHASNTAGKWTLALELALGAVLVAAWARRRYRPHKVKAAVVDAHRNTSPRGSGDCRPWGIRARSSPAARCRPGR